MNYNAWQFWFSIVQFLCTVGAWFYIWWTNREKVTNKRFEEHADLLAAHAQSINTLEVRVENLPVCNNHDRMENNDREITRRLDLVDRGLSKIEGLVEGRMEGIGAALDTIQQHLLNGGK